MIKEFVGDIFDAPIDVLLQGCNCHCVQGSGLAGQLRKYYPEAYEVDLQTTPGDRSKLGDYTVAHIKDLRGRRSKTIRMICNCYSQYDFGSESRKGDYEAIFKVLQNINAEFNGKGLTIGIPYKFASGLAGCDFRIVKTMIDVVFENSNIKVLICRRPGD